MKRRRGQGGLIAALALAALLVFLAGEAVLFARSKEGSLYLAQRGLVHSRSKVTESVEETVRNGLRRLGLAAGTPDAEATEEETGPVYRWDIALPARASLFLVNSEITQSLESHGGRVFDGWETNPASTGESITMRVGVGNTVTHELVFTRQAGEGENEVRLAVLIEGFGPEDADSLGRVALALPFTFSGAVVANERSAKKWSEELKKDGREVVTQIPMEPMNYPTRSPGPDAVLVDMTKNQIRRLVKKHLHATPGRVAALPYLGAMALQDADAMRAVTQELREEKVAYVEVAGEAHSVGLESASHAGVPFLRLDGRVEPGRGTGARATRAVREQLRDLADTARRRGFAACVARLEPRTLVALRSEVPALEKQGVKVVPLSALLRPSVY